MEKFRKLGISEAVLKSIQEQNFETPSEIQEKSIPLILEGKDVIAGAATGSGKTLVFASAIIKTAEKGLGVQALILTPTRELAEQVSTTIQKFSKNKHLEIISVYGGVSINPQMYNLRTADVVVGTPGRILDHLDRRTIDLRNIKILVLDEADRMLDMGFKDDVDKIISQCPEKRQTLLFSATITQDVSRLAKKYMKNPVEISAEAYVDPSKLTQIYYDVEDNQKFSLLVHFLKNEKSGLAMVFCNTQRNTDFIANNLRALGIDSLAIHGGYSQDRRTRTMQKFNEQKVSVLICTDVAARGLDIKGVSHVYNYDMPKDSKDYIHRIGRTARAGKDGRVINIIASRDYDNFGRIMTNREFTIVKGENPEIERVFIKFKDSRSRSSGFNRDNRSYPGRESRGRGNSSYSRPYHNRESHGSEEKRYGDNRNYSPRRSSGGEGRYDNVRSYNRPNYNRENRSGESRFGNRENRFGGSRFKSNNYGNRESNRFSDNRREQGDNSFRENRFGNNRFGEDRRSSGNEKRSRFGDDRKRFAKKRWDNKRKNNDRPKKRY